MSAAATIYKLHAPEPTEVERSRAEARATIASARADLRVSTAPRIEDPVQAWKRDGEERLARERAAKRSERVADRMVRVDELQRRQSAETGSWAEWVGGEIRTAVAAEHERMIEIIAGVVAQERAQAAEELQTKIKALEAANAELRGLLFEKVGAIAERVGRAQLELGQRLATCERAMIGFKAQCDTIEQTFDDVRAYYRKLYGE